MVTFLLFVIALPILLVLAVIALRIFFEALPWALLFGAIAGVLVGIGYGISALPDDVQNFLGIGLAGIVVFAVPAALIGLPIAATIWDVIKQARRKPRD